MSQIHNQRPTRTSLCFLMPRDLSRSSSERRGVGVGCWARPPRTSEPRTMNHQPWSNHEPSMRPRGREAPGSSGSALVQREGGGGGGGVAASQGLAAGMGSKQNSRQQVLFSAASRATSTSTGPEPKIWAAPPTPSPDENTPWGPNQPVRSTPRGHGTWDGGAATQLVPAHRGMASLWSPRAQVGPFCVLHGGSGPWALARRRRGPHGRPRAGPSPNWSPRTAGPASGARGCPLKCFARRRFSTTALLH
jgi:hypothetical protein